MQKTFCPAFQLSVQASESKRDKTSIEPLSLVEVLFVSILMPGHSRRFAIKARIRAS